MDSFEFSYREGVKSVTEGTILQRTQGIGDGMRVLDFGLESKNNEDLTYRW